MREDPLNARAIFDILAGHRVDYIVLGGFAVGAHGYIRATKDIDIVPDPDPLNLERLAASIAELDGRVRGVEEFSDDELPQPDAEGLALGGNWVMDTKHGRFDVLQLVSDFEYADLASSAVESEVFGHQIRFCGYDHLVAMKKAAGRDEDLLDLKRLREMREEG
ncbi:MAG: hypothetical protein H0V25_05625 [Solirubrobacterales bacterium]|nr:hypothetical protein [Solirubrobacterales bacterium]